MGFEVLEVDELQRREVRPLEDDRAGRAGLERFRPACRAHAPLVTWLQTGKAELRVRRDEIVAATDGELEELLRHLAAHDVQAGVVTPVLAAPRPVVAGERIERTRNELVTQHVALLHGSI